MFNIRVLILFFCFAILNATSGYSNDIIRCSAAEVFKRNAAKNPVLLQRKQQQELAFQQWLLNKQSLKENGIQALITIPVVIHIVYKNETENISDQQIQTQLDILNKDFRNLNADKLPSQHPFFPLTGNAGFEFCLANLDPNGNATTGITRTNTTIDEFTDDDLVKFDSLGGANGWNAEKYLNIWVCDLGNQLLGYATFPTDLSDNPQADGVVINFTAFGTLGTAKSPFDRGRTATHEIGHWLNLEHIWGDDTDCSGTDGVDDTPDQRVETINCPSGVLTDICTATAPGIMYQNFMDYTDDACMVMFSNGQAERMRFFFEELRSEMLTNNICSGTTNIGIQNASRLKIYPNPVQNYLMIEGLPKTRSRFYTVDIFNAIGQKVYTNSINTEDQLIEMSDFKSGTYMMMIYNEEFSATQKLTVVK